MSHIFTEDTKRIRGTFKDYSDVLADPDDNDVTVTIYDADLTSIDTDTATRQSAGIYYFDWTAPDVEGTYFIEFKGLFLTKPQLTRKKVKVKFKPDAE